MQLIELVFKTQFS